MWWLKREDIPGASEGDPELALDIKCCIIFGVYMDKQSRNCKIHCKSPQKRVFEVI